MALFQKRHSNPCNFLHTIFKGKQRKKYQFSSYLVYTKLHGLSGLFRQIAKCKIVSRCKEMLIIIWREKKLKVYCYTLHFDWFVSLSF